MDFSQEDLFDVVDRVVRETLEQSRILQPPVDTLLLAEETFGLRIEYAESEDRHTREYGAPAKKRYPAGTIVLSEDQSPEASQILAARAIVKQLIPPILAKLGIPPGTENRSADRQLVALIVQRLLLPTRWFAQAARASGYDLLELKEQFSTASYEMIAWRMLEVDEEGSVIAIIDDGAVASRRSNRFSVNKSLTAAEQACWDHVAEIDEPIRIRREDWTAWGWPINGIPYRRIILRAVPDEI